MNIKRFQKLKRLEKRLSFAQAQTNGQTLNLKFRPVWNEPCRRHFRTIFHVNIVFRRQNSLPFVQVFQRARWWKEWRLRNRFKIKRSTGIRLNDEPRASDARRVKGFCHVAHMKQERRTRWRREEARGLPTDTRRAGIQRALSPEEIPRRKVPHVYKSPRAIKSGPRQRKREKEREGEEEEGNRWVAIILKRRDNFLG